MVMTLLKQLCKKLGGGGGVVFHSYCNNVGGDEHLQQSIADHIFYYFEPKKKLAHKPPNHIMTESQKYHFQTINQHEKSIFKQ